MKYHYICILWFLCILGDPSGVLHAQEIEPPAWAVGDWWVVKTQRYDSGGIIRKDTPPRWLPPQAWRFDVEQQESIAGQPYFVVAVRPIEDNPCPYWFRYWFRQSDRYIARYELHQLKSSTANTRNLASSVVRKDFDPAGTTPFLTTTFPTLPLAVPVFAVESENSETFANEQSISSTAPAYASPEFEMLQEVQSIAVKSLTEKAHPDFLGLVGNIPQEGNVFITISTTIALQEKQHWNPQFPWCIYGESVENSEITRRYWLVKMGRN
ncbi:hypothetical protein U27_01887 [Candidatus Vecturithrix granuli]|uniref:Uncharacterized protein n=1 Tax=Vecturithrix granuli TaxID=1499967 RepID=A0A0S6W608_VECG1|nr:hypothetical protein U27_01887 [Candidatus Vecturithrix granuli]